MYSAIKRQGGITMAVKQRTHKERVYSIVKRSGKKGIITPLVMSRGFEQGIGNADRRLRELQEMGLIKGVKLESSRVKSWVVA